MYSLTWTEKPYPCSALYNADLCEQCQEVYTNYLDAAVRYLELYSVGTSEICRVRLWQRGVGDLGRKVKTDSEAVRKYLLQTYGEEPSEERLNKTLQRLDPNRVYLPSNNPYYATHCYTPPLANKQAEVELATRPRTFGGFVF